MSLVLQATNLKKKYHGIGETLCILNNISFAVKKGERVAITGNSGSGKTTLLNVLSGLDRPDSGQVTIADEALYDLEIKALNRLRNKKIGFVFQFHYLLEEFNAYENIAMPLLIQKDLKMSEIRERTEYVLQQVGLIERKHHKPAALSGGERQRVAIARALISNPLLVFLDEPTGNLDHYTADKIHTLLDNVCNHFDTAFVVVTHDHTWSLTMDHTWKLEEGNLYALG